MNSILQFGDSIMLYSNKENNFGFLCATGFIENGVYLKGIQNKLDLDQIDKNEFSNINSRDFIFKITPKLNFDFHKEYKKTLKKYKKLKEVECKSSNAKNNLKDLKDFLFKKTKKLNERLNEEKNLNENILKQSEKKFITYGSYIQLMHNDSESYICSKDDCSDSEKIGYKIYLNNWFSSGMIFKILPKFNSRQNGDLVQINDDIILQNIKNNYYLDISEDFGKTILLNNNPNNPFISPLAIDDYSGNLKGIFLSQENNTSFNIILNRKVSKSMDFIKGFDLITLRHSEIQGYLNADYKFNSNEIEVYIKKYIGDHSEEEYNLNSVWVIEHKQLNNNGNDFRINPNNSIYLRHFISGRYIKYKNKDENTKSFQSEKNKMENIIFEENIEQLKFNEFKCIIDNDSNNENIGFQFEPIMKIHENICNGSTYNINSSKLDCYLKNVNQIITPDFKKFKEEIDEEYSGDFEFLPLEDKDLDSLRYKVILQKEISSEDAFIVKRLNEKEKNDILFIRSGLSTLIYFSNIFRNNLENFHDIYIEVKNILIKIIQFLFDYDNNSNLDIYDIEINPKVEKQKIVKDMQLIDILVDIIYYPFKNNFYNFDNNKNDFLFKIISLSYTCLRYSIKEYRPSELYASQWMNLFLKHTLNAKKKKDIQAGKMLTELIDNNKRILENRIKPEIITQIIEFMYEHEKDEKFVNILIAICICDDEPMISNQRDISKILLKTKKAKNLLLFDLEENKNDNLIYLKTLIPNYQLISLKNLEKEEQFFGYITNLIMLLSYLCKNRNYIAINILKEKYPFDICFKILNSDLYHNDIKKGFISLIENLWIDVTPFQIEKIPKLIIFVSENNDYIDLDINIKEKDKYSSLKSFIQKFMKNITETDSFKNNSLYLAIFDLCIKMLNLGFFNDFNSLELLVENIINYFKGMNKILFKSKTEELTKIENNAIYDNYNYKVSLVRIKLLYLLERIIKLKQNPLIENFVKEFINKNILNKNDDASELVNINSLEFQKKINDEIFYEFLIKNVKLDLLFNKNKYKNIIIELTNLIQSGDRKTKEKCLKILKILNSLNKIIFNYFKFIQIIDSNYVIEDYTIIKNKSIKLHCLSDSYEIWNDEDDDEGKFLELKNILYDLLTYMIPKLKLKNFNINNQFTKKYLILNDFINIYCFKNDNTEFFQILFKNLSVYDYLVEILNYDVEVNKNKNSEELSKKFKLIYIFLLKCLEKNKKNKKYFTNFLKIIQNHISRNITNESWFLYNKLLVDNKEIIKTNKFDGSLKFIINEIKENKDNFIKLSIFLNCLTKLIKYKGKEIKYNQIQIISVIIENKFLLLFINENMKNYLKIKNKIKFYENILYLQKVITLNYFNSKLYLCIEILNLLYECSYGKNSFTEKICQNLISITDIFNIIKENENMVIKLFIIKFFYSAYLLNEQDNINQLNELFNDIFYIFIREFNDLKIIFESINKSSSNIFYLLISGPISYQELINLYFKYLGSCLVIMCQNLIGNDNSEFMNEHFKNDLDNLNNNLIIIIDYINDSNLRSILNNLKSKIIQINNKIAKFQLKQENLDFIIDKKKTKRRKVTHIKTTILHSNILSYMELSHKSFKKSDYFNKLIEGELNKYVLFTYKPENNQDKINFQELLKGLINFFTEDHNEIPSDILNFGIEYLIKVVDICKESNINKSLIDFDENEDYNKALLINRQNHLVSINICKLVCNLLNTKIPKYLLKNVLVLAIYLLYGGNQKSQNSFYENLKDSCLYSSNIIIENIYLVLNTSFDRIKKKMKIINYDSLKENYYSFEEIKIVKNNKENKFKEIEWDLEICELIFRFLQLLCEGHNLTLQKFLLNQNRFKNYVVNNINLISKSASYWGSYIKFVNYKSSKLGFKILEFLIEATQGPCLENQQELFNFKIIDYSRDFMNDFCSKRDFLTRNFNDNNKHIIEEMITLNIKLLNSLLEGNQNLEIANSLGQNIEFNFLISKLKIFFYNLFNNKIDEKNLSLEMTNKFIYKDIFDGKNAEAFNIYFFIKTINEKTNIYNDNINKLEKDEKLIFEFFYYHSAHIEFVFNGELHKIYFVIQPSCRFLDENTKLVFLDNLKRDTPNEKITDLINKAGNLFDIMDHMTELRTRFKLINNKSFKYIRDGCLIFIFLINFVIFITFENKIENNRATLYIPEFYKILIFVLGIIYLILCVLMTILWLLINGKLIILDGWREKFKNYKKNLITLKNEKTEIDEEFDEILLNLNKNINEISKNDKLKIIKYYNNKQGYIQSIVSLEYYQNNVLFLLTNNNLMFFLLLIIFTIFAINGSYILFCIPMLDIIHRFDTLQNVIKAITFNKKQLILTALFGIIIVYFYAIFAFIFIDETFFMFDVGPAGESVCNSLIQCFLTIMSLGPRSSGSIGDILLRPSFTTQNWDRFYVRYIFDVSIFFVLNITTMKLIFGIIIDTFGELRDKKNAKDHDKNNICFICSLEKYIFDKNSDGFNNHLKRDHNIWNYIFFMYYLKKKPETEFNGNESYIYEKIFKEDISWIPIRKTLTIKDPEKEKNKIEDKIKIAQVELNKLEEKILKFKNEIN